MGTHKTVDLIGKRFGMLTVIKELPAVEEFTVSRRRRRRLFECLCECGQTAQVQYDHLRQGKTRSCGCYFIKSSRKNVKFAHKALTKHGMCASRVYKAWIGMKLRCSNRNARSWPAYGGRGISVCHAWKNSFEAFLRDMGEPPPGTSLDRINNNGNYTPENCRWATHRQQAVNKRSNVILVYNGQTKTAVEWAEELGLSDRMLHDRIKRGWSAKRAIETPLLPRQKPFEHNGIVRTVCEWSKITGIERRTLTARIKLGWSITQALETPVLRRK